jgi:RimJ/RimL family protein N-acetyltransferase
MENLPLKLEVLEIRHAQLLFDALDDEKVGEFIGGPDVTTVKDLENRIRHLLVGPPADSGQRWYNFTVMLDETVIGRVEATTHAGITEIAYLLSPKYWNRGLGTSATGLMIEKLKAEGHFDFWATVTPGNEGSVRVLKKLGFVETEMPTSTRLLSYEPSDLVFRLFLL